MLAALRSLVLTLWLGLLAGACAHAAVKVVIVSSERTAAYQEAAQSLVSELERSGLEHSEVLEVTVAEWAVAEPLAPRLFVALGTAAATVLANTQLQIPVLCTLLPRTSFEAVLANSGRKASARFSALYLDQPWSRQLDLIHLALPDARNIGVLWGSQSQSQAAALNLAARAQGMKLVEASVAGDDLFPGLKRVLEDVDVLLAVPDPNVYNSGSIQNILLTSFRLRVPLVAFSPAYVHAGALLAVHVTPKQLGLQAGAIASGVLQGKALSATPLYSQEFSIAVNVPVARSLGLSLNSDALGAQLRRREARP
jgi:ABC-type uncharacterized transport system substrate-binding protein